MKTIILGVASLIICVPVLLLSGPIATLTGRIADPSGAVITAVKVEATSEETNITFTGETNEQGLYTIPDLPPGTYRLTVSKSDFQTIIKPEVQLRVLDVVQLNFTMQIGTVAETITVEGGAPLIQTGPQRGGNFSARDVSVLPLVRLSPLSLARSLPGVTELSGSFLPVDAQTTEFSVNGQRPVANNYLLDGTENNELVLTGPAQQFNIADAVEEVVVQAGNFGAEFGRAGGGIFNVVTKSGTNNFHGTALWRYQSQRFNSVANLDKRNGIPKSVFSRNIYGFTIGGPVRKDRTFFFGGFQEDTFRSTRNFTFTLPTDTAVSRLRSLFPSNPRLELYLGPLGNLRGAANPFSLQLGIDPQTGEDRGAVSFAAASLAMPQSRGGPQWIAKVDHILSSTHRFAFRTVADRLNDSINSLTSSLIFPGFIPELFTLDRNLLFTDHYTFSPAWTNEFRLSYSRQEISRGRVSPMSVPEAHTLPRVAINSGAINSPGLSGDEQSAKVDNIAIQETQTRLTGRHTLRYGVDLLKQLATQLPASNSRGIIDYNSAPGYSAFANFLDDFSGVSGRWRKTFGATVFHPDQFRHSYFFQDTWLAAPSLTLTLGIRYENFGQPANALRFPAFAGFDPAKFLEPNRVNKDNNNFGPAVGLAWSPSSPSGWVGKLLGDRKTVLRSGYQVTYDAFYTQLVSLMLAGSAPNALTADVIATTGGRGAPNWLGQEPQAGQPVTALNASQDGVLDKNLRTPYTQRWSLGFQRQLSNNILIDGSYVGAVGHKLTTWTDANPQQPNGQRPYPQLGRRRVRTSEGNSSYHSMQWRAEQRFSNGFQANASYTWSKFLDSTSEGIGAVITQGNQSNLTSMPVAQGGLRLDHGPSDYDRPHRLTIQLVWNLPSPANSLLGGILDGWSIAGIATFQSGTPYTVRTGAGSDRNGDGWNNDRPDIGNPKAPIDSRAVIVPATTCPTLYRNPDKNECVNPADVRWVDPPRGLLPNAATVGRNTLRTGGANNLDLSLSRTIRVKETTRLEIRWEASNALNHPQFTSVPPGTNRDLVDAAPSRFLNRDFTDSGIRSMWGQLKLLF